MRILKFGGTSVGSAERVRGVIEIVRGRASSGPVVVVVSAQAGVTDQLIDLARKAAAGTPETGSPVRERLERLAADLGVASDLVDEDLDDLETFLRGIGLVRELTLRSLDYVTSFGERCSAKLVAAAMRDAGLPAEAYMAYDAGLVTDSNYGAARVLEPTYERIPAALVPALARGVLPVVTGFIAKDADDVVTTLGRGGSDYSAAIFGAALDADEIEIWTDVDGVMSADPRIVPAAHSLERMSFSEAAELAYYGAKVIHPATIQPAVRRNIPIRVLNTLRPAHRGTLIVRDVPDPPRGVRSIASKARITAIHVTSARMLLQHGFMLRMFQVFAEHEVVIDLIATSEVSVTVTTDSARPLDDVQRALAEIRGVEARVVPGKSILCLVGDHIRAHPGLLERVFASLGSGDPPGSRPEVHVEMVSVGMSGRNVSLLVDGADEHRAVRALHAEFFPGG